MYPLQNRFFVNALYGEDQLRQRVAFALHQIIVVSGVEVTQPSWMAPYLQILDRNAFGNYRQLLYDITLNPAMGNYLDINGNTRTRPNENYAREVLQLFSIGTFELNLDGTHAARRERPADPDLHAGRRQQLRARLHRLAFRAAPRHRRRRTTSTRWWPTKPQHDAGAKTLLNGVVAARRPEHGQGPERRDRQHLQRSERRSVHLEAADSASGDEQSEPGLRRARRRRSSMAAAASARGDLKAVVRAILLDPEARGDVKTEPNYGRLRHPAQFIANILRAFNARSADGTATSDGYLNPQSVQMGMDVFRPPSVFSYFSPSTGVPGSGGVRGPEFGALLDVDGARAAPTSSTRWCSRASPSARTRRSGTSLDLSAAAGAGRRLRARSSTRSTSCCCTARCRPEMRNSIVGAVTAVAAVQHAEARAHRRVSGR